MHNSKCIEYYNIITTGKTGLKHIHYQCINVTPKCCTVNAHTNV